MFAGEMIAGLMILINIHINIHLTKYKVCRNKQQTNLSMMKPPTSTEILCGTYFFEVSEMNPQIALLMDERSIISMGIHNCIFETL